MIKTLQMGVLPYKLFNKITGEKGKQIKREKRKTINVALSIALSN